MFQKQIWEPVVHVYVITCNETWAHHHDPKTKQKSSLEDLVITGIKEDPLG